MNFLAREARKANLPVPVQEEMDRTTAMIEKATSDILLGVDWATNLEIVDTANRTQSEDVRREIVRQVRKRLQHRSPRVVNLALSLAEALVKNCDTPLHREVATPKFMAQMARLGRTYREKAGRENLEVAVKALELIQSWGETFLPQASTLPLFAQTYHELKREGLPFRKQYDETQVPVLTPPASTRPKPPMRLNTQVDRDLLDSVETSAGMLRDLMHTADTPDDLATNDVFQEVLEQCQKLVRQLQQAIESKVMDGVEDLDAFFKANDDLQTTMQTWEGVKDGTISLPLPRDMRFFSNATEDSEPEQFEDFLAGGTDTKRRPSDAPQAGGGGASYSLSSSSGKPPPAEDPVPKLPPSRRDSFGKPSNRPSRLSRGQSAAADLLDLSSLDISDQKVPVPQSAPSKIASQPQQLFDFAAAPASKPPAITTTAGTGSTSSFQAQASFNSLSGSLTQSSSAADPFAIPVLPPPRSHVSPTLRPASQSTFASPTAYSSTAPSTSMPGSSTATDLFAFGAGPVVPQQQQPQSAMLSSSSGYGASRPTSGSFQQSMPSYPAPPQPPQQAQPTFTGFPPPPAPQQTSVTSSSGYGAQAGLGSTSGSGYYGYAPQAMASPFAAPQQPPAPQQQQQPPPQQAQQWATFGSSAPQQQPPSAQQNPFDQFPF